MSYMQGGNVRGGAEFFQRHSMTNRADHAPCAVTPIHSQSLINHIHDPSDDSLERFSVVASSICDELQFAGYDHQAYFLFDLCINLAESGASDAEIGHTAFEYIKNFPEVADAINNMSREQSHAIRRISSFVIMSNQP